MSEGACESKGSGGADEGKLEDLDARRIRPLTVDGRDMPEQFKPALAALTELYNVHDKVFVAKRSVKQAMLREKQAAVLLTLDSLPSVSSPYDQGVFAYIKGKACNVSESYSIDAELHLSRAVKLCPWIIDAWNCLGTCFWKKKDLSTARSCFQGAIDLKPTAESLRHLSMILRQFGTTPEEKATNLKSSIEKAKEALALALDDGESWYVLGNGYLSLFFGTSHDPADLSRALSAYTNAVANGSLSNPDLHFNRANVLKFLEDYQEAVAAFQTAGDIDPTLPAQDEIESLTVAVRHISDLIIRKGRTKPKRFAQLCASIPDAVALDLPVEDAEERCPVALVDLSPGKNPGKLVTLKLVISAGRLNQTPVCLVMADKSQTIVSVSLYHLDEKECAKFSSGDVFVILDPVVKEISLEVGGKDAIGYRTVQVFSPDKFVVNGKSMASSFVHADLKVTNF